MDRRVTVEQVRAMIQLAKQHGIETGTFIMLGYPGETDADVEATIEHLKRADPDQFTITVSYPIKGTPFYDDVVNDMIDPGPWDQTTDRDIKLRRPRSSLYYWFATTRLLSEVRGAKLLRRERTARSALALARHGLKAMVGRAGMRLDPALLAVETFARAARRRNAHARS
jgi:radical SAM superfamily enzyme YgiQ (UPF0313 family)